MKLFLQSLVTTFSLFTGIQAGILSLFRPNWSIFLTFNLILLGNFLIFPWLLHNVILQQTRMLFFIFSLKIIAFFLIVGYVSSHKYALAELIVSLIALPLWMIGASWLWYRKGG